MTAPCPTPRTDAALCRYTGGELVTFPKGLRPVVDADFARQLERELAEARAMPAGAAIDAGREAARKLIQPDSCADTFADAVLRAALSNTTGLVPDARAAVNTALAKDPAGENPAPVSLSPQAPAEAERP